MEDKENLENEIIVEKNDSKDDEMSEEIKKENIKQKKKKNVIVPIIIILVIAIILIVCCLFFIKVNDKKVVTKQTVSNNKFLDYRISSNKLENFDLYFLQLENSKKNKVYSPLSIKYALEMLAEGAKGETEEQISNIIGTYSAKKYPNNSNMSFANALFVKDTYKDSINSSYINTLQNKYNAEVIYDSFKKADVLNSWVSNKTFKLIDNVSDDISQQDFLLVNALAIDMEWVNLIQKKDSFYSVNYDHEDFNKYVDPLALSDYHQLEFKDLSKKVKSTEIGAAINKYDIIKEVGEEQIRETVGKEYEKWIAQGACGEPEKELPTDVFLNTYINELGKGYGQVSSSTDFEFYDDENVKMFAKDLKEYSGITLQYIGIMPKKDELDTFIDNNKADDINTLIKNLKPIKLSSFKEGVITEISGYIPMFNFEYDLDIMNDLKKLGIVNVFDPNKANLSKLSSTKPFINTITHKANIEFSNEGIKASAVTVGGGAGDGGCWFDYLYKVPVEKIDLTFDKPYMFIIRDKKSQEVWFVGTVYSPEEYKPSPILQ